MSTITRKQRIAYKYLKDDVTRFILFGGGSGGGKTWLGCEWLMLCCHFVPGSRWFIGRNDLKSSRRSVLVTWHKVTKWHNYEKYKTTDDGIFFDNGSEIVLLDLSYYPYKDPMYERFGSLEFTGGWIEEAGEVHEKAFEVLKSRIGRHNFDGLPEKMLITCNPKKNWLYTTFYAPYLKDELPPQYAYVPALVSDNPYLGKSYIKTMEEIREKSTRERLLFGNWDYDDNPNALVEYDAILDCFTNTAMGGIKRISADLAMQGRDRFVAGVWNGLRVNVSIDQPKATGKSIETDLKNLMQNNQIGHPQTIVDSDGLGAYLESYLRGIKEFHGGKRAWKPEIYINLKTECAYKLAEVINDRKLQIVCTHEQKTRIIEELGLLQADNVDADTKRKSIISKEKMKETIGRSPDYLDMLIMGMYFQLAPTFRPPRIILT